MTELRLETLTMPGAEVGPENPLPDLSAFGRVPGAPAADASVPESARTYLGYGCGEGLLPYRAQDGYGRDRRPRPFRTAVLENDLLRATFLLDHGGRLRSLYHKGERRELVYVNPVFQPCNFAVRNAWVSGGVEWNCGVPGHTPLTCSPVFAASVRSDEGWPVLRLWEFERQRVVPYQMDFLLPPGSEWLFVRVRLFNPHETTIPLYWWSNIAMPEAPGVRVLAPAEAAYNHAYQGGLRRVPVPVFRDRDVSYPVNVPASADFFYDIGTGQMPWLAAVGPEGVGLVQTSTAAQRGRKLFVWGAGPGARQWQRLLTDGDHPYFEIQAGVARTQYESFPMAPRAELAWVEAYGSLHADPARVHGRDWAAACGEVEAQVRGRLPPERLDDVLKATAAMAAGSPGDLLHRGSGWGALEERRRRRAGQSPLSPPSLVFDAASLSGEQEPWLSLLEGQGLPESDQPGAWMVQAEWRALLETSADDHWLAWLHRGVMRAHVRDLAGAEAAWRRSLARRRTAWALRQLAACERASERRDEAARLWCEARAELPGLLPLAVECLEALLAAGRAAEAFDLAQRLPEGIAGAGRILAMRARAALSLGRLDEAERVLLGDLVIPDLREGHVLLSDLWYDLQAQRLAVRSGGPVTDALRETVRRTLPLPAHLDFRQAAEA